MTPQGLIILFYLLYNSVDSLKPDYCDPELCKLWNGSEYVYLEHIGCNNSGKFGEACPQDASVVKFSDIDKKLILNLHNSARNRIALGHLQKYDPALNMPTVKWDYELEYLASLNVKTCIFAHDNCRNTENYLFSGQNLGYSWKAPPKPNTTRADIKWIITLWFNEYKNADRSFIANFRNHPEGKKIGHFTVMVSDNVKRVGCAAVRYSKKSGQIFLIACNYDYTNIIGGSVYEAGLTGTNCSHGTSEFYPGLCKWRLNSDYDNVDTFKKSGAITNQIFLIIIFLIIFCIIFLL